MTDYELREKIDAIKKDLLVILLDRVETTMVELANVRRH